MAGHAGRIAAMIFHALLKRELQNVGIGEVDLRDSRRRRWGRVVENIFQQPDASLQRVGILAIGIHRQQAGLSEKASPVGLRCQRHFAKLVSKNLCDPIVGGKSLVEHGVVSVKEIQHATVLLQQFMKEGDGLFFHRVSQVDVELIEEFFVHIQKIKKMGEAGIMAQGQEAIVKGSIMGALALYLDFINLFLMLLRFFGGSRN